MSWETINVADITVAEDKGGRTTFEPIPDGTYTLQLLSAQMSQFENSTGTTNVTFAVADEGSDYIGRRVFFDIPNPERVTWAPEVYARLVNALGATVTPFTAPVDELNRLSQNGHSRIMADVYIESYPKKDGTMGRKNKIRYKSLRAAA